MKINNFQGNELSQCGKLTTRGVSNLIRAACLFLVISRLRGYRALLRRFVYGLTRLHLAVSVAILRYAAGQRHVRMNAKPSSVVLSREYDCGPARTIEKPSIYMETGARPRRDRDRHCAIR